MRAYAWMATRYLIALLLAAVVLVPALVRRPAHATTAHSPYGGTLVATTSGDPEDLDPAISYGWQGYNMLHNVFNGLLGYKPDSTTLVPDIAAAWPTISQDGLVWTFTLRHGVMFQPPVNREVQAADFKYSWERVLNPRTASPGVTFFLDIAGARAYNRGKAKEVSGIRVLGPYTLEIHLLKPYVPFKYVMAMTFSYVVPHETADKYPKDFSHHAVGTGPFMLSQWVRDQQVVFVRNPHLRTWPYDPARARKLLAQAGYPHGFKTTITANATAASQATVEQVMQRDLARIGIKATIKIATGTTYTTMISTPKAVAIGDTGWTLDFPDPSDFIDPILTSTAAVPGGSNFAFYRNPTVDALAAQADHTLSHAQRCRLYHRMEQIIVDDAPWVPLYTPVHDTLAAPRVTSFYLNHIWYAFDFAYYRVGK